MRLSTSSAIIVCLAAVAISGSHAFVLSKREVAVPGALDIAKERPVVGALVDLRGGKTVRAKKSGSGSAAKSSKTSAKGKSKKKSKSSKSSKPSFIETIKAFFVSLVNPHFALKLQARQKNQIHTVHGSASSVDGSA